MFCLTPLSVVYYHGDKKDLGLVGIGINIFTLTVLKLKKKSISWKRIIALKIMECSFRIDLNPFLWRWKVIQAFFAGTKSHQLWWQLLRWGRPLGAKNYGWRKTLHHSTWKAQCSVAFFYQNWTFRSDNFKRIFWFLQFFQEKNEKKINLTVLCSARWNWFCLFFGRIYDTGKFFWN